MVKRNLRDTIKPFFTLLFAGTILAMTPLRAQVGDLVFLSDDQTETASSIHFVKAGETLYSLSRKYDLPVERIKSLNGLNQNTIYPGQRLIVETTTRSATVSTTTTARVAAPAQEDPIRTPDLTPTQERTRSLGDLFVNDSPNPPSTATYTTDAYLVSRMREREEVQDPSTTKIEKRVYYQVRKGDDLFSIADTYQVSPEEILEWNAISNITPGQAIIVAKRYESATTEDLKAQQARETAERARLARSQWETNNQPQSRGVSERTAAPTPNYNMQSYAPETASSYRTTGSSYENSSPRSNPAANTIERGSFRQYVDNRITQQRFYAAHKTLAPGSKFKLMIPNNAGFVEVEVVSRLDPQNPAMVALSPACLKVLEGAGSGADITIMYE
ncbi:MAG: LysM peptidoglycan-binding domain-containing protein [Bacteroidia bacterium]